MRYSDPNDPVSAALRHRVLSAGDRAGQVLTSLVDNELVRTARHSSAPPFMPESYREQVRQHRQATNKYNQAARSYPMDEVDGAGWGERSTEASIFDHAVAREDW